ncbi:MAG TPA: epoxyqueuosine reductase [Syntrophothermus lipocalidus]|uniref:epoxyqueuosine reductase n=1 Tax=Syntrophothermus sp. TaxID=2736299 RepID=UPI001815DC29|nr:4Fe-4S binding protein [Syntrophothermus sp.]NSW81891.1 epoxyqueuosine reductase [Syntrophothermus sp.]HHV75858.1 epoxyqueuosine reductase [Syntrophothermus lipocalidus]
MNKLSTEPSDLKLAVVSFCREQGADVVGFASVERWNEQNEVPGDHRPQTLFPPAKTVIVIGLSMPLPVVETTPSILHKEAYDTTNRQLDSLALALVRYLNARGHASHFFSRDGFGSLGAIKEKPGIAFNHIPAARYAGLGTVGLSNLILTPEFGSRVRFVSVFTAAPIPGDPMIEKDLCIQCGACARLCPVNAIIPVEGSVVGNFDREACLERHIELTRKKRYPCGICTKVCPVGKDRLLYRQKGIIKKYENEEETLKNNPDHPDYKSWTVVRRFGTRD